MSKIVVPAKPSWKITLVVDTANQVQIQVEDLNDNGAAITIVGSPISRISRHMNQLELALLLTGVVQSTLVNTLQISKRGLGAAQKTNHD